MFSKSQNSTTSWRSLGIFASVAASLFLGSLSTEVFAQDHAKSKKEMAKEWKAIAKQPDFWQGTWMSINPIAEDFRTPQPKYTPFALDYIGKSKRIEDSPFTNCAPLGMPFIMYIGGMPMKFFQSPGMIALYVETAGMTRFIHTDGRKHSEQPNPTFLGESVAHWEGDTLVVSTTGFNEKSLFQIGVLPEGVFTEGDPSPLANVVFAPHGPNLSIVERIRLVDFETMEIVTTYDDDTIFKEPYTSTPRLYIRGTDRRNDPQEWACTDNRDYLDPETGKLEYNVQDKAISR